MTDVFVPGLVVAGDVPLVRTIPFATGGRPAVAPGDRVEADTVVGYQSPRGYLVFVNLARELDCAPDVLAECLLCREGDRVRAGQVLARLPGVLGFGTRECRSPVDGTVEQLSLPTGKLAVRADPAPVRAFLPGRVTAAGPAAAGCPGGGVVIASRGALLQGVFGLGPERAGPLAVRAGAPGEAADPAALGPADAGAVVVAGAHASGAFLERAAALGAAAVVAGSAHLADLERLCGRPLGLVVSGGEAVPLAVVLTEGFGRWPMAERAFGLLASLAGRTAYVSPQTQVRAGVVRPQLAVPLEAGPAARTAAAPGPAAMPGPEAPRGTPLPTAGLAPGVRVRVVGGRHFGRIGAVAALVPGVAAFPNEVAARAARVALDGGETVTVARRNLELLEG